MAPSVPSIGEGQGYRPCLRNRDPNDQAFASEAPLSKKKCPQGPGFCKRTATGREVEIMGEQVVEFESFGPRTPTKDEASDRNSEGSWEMLELCLLERISQSLSVPDLCRLSQVLHESKTLGSPYNEILVVPICRGIRVYARRSVHWAPSFALEM